MYMLRIKKRKVSNTFQTFPYILIYLFLVNVIFEVFAWSINKIYQDSTQQVNYYHAYQGAKDFCWFSV